MPGLATVTTTPSLNGATFSHDGSLVVTADDDGSACVWKVSNGQLVQVFTEPAGVSGGVAGGLGVGGSAMRWAVFSPDGKQVLTANDDGTARLWDVSSGKQLQVVSEPTGEAINDAWFSPDGTQVVTASNDGTARIWSAATGTLLQTLTGPGRDPVYNAAFSRNDELVVTCSGSAAVIWNAKTGQQLTEFQYGNYALGLRVQSGRQRGRHSGRRRTDPDLLHRAGWRPHADQADRGAASDAAAHRGGTKGVSGRHLIASASPYDGSSAS